MSIDRMGIHIGTLLYIRFYGIILMSGAIAGAFLAEREVRRRKMNDQLIWDALIWLLVGGIIGARIWHILTPPPSMVAQGTTTAFYLTHPLDALAIWNGGLGIVGGVAGGALALYWFARRQKIPFLVWADIAAPSVALAQAIGRWGNFVNEELYGAPTNLPWKIFIEPKYRLPQFANVAYYHPLFLYESLWNLMDMAILLWLGRKYADRLKPGDIILTYLIIYPIGRFLLEFLRLDASRIAGINANQSLMVVIILLSAAALLWRHRKQPTTAAA